MSCNHGHNGSFFCRKCGEMYGCIESNFECDCSCWDTDEEKQY